MFVCIASDTPSSKIMQTAGSAILHTLDPYGSSDKVGSRVSNLSRVYQSLAFNTPESLNEEVPTHCPHSGLVIASWLRIDNRCELAQLLDIDVASMTDPQIVLASYRKWGEDCVNRLTGDFSFVIVNPADGSMFAARDPVGVKPLYYLHNDQSAIFTSGARMFFAIDGLDLQPKPDWMARYVVGISESFTDTPWPNVHKLPPGHSLSFCNGAITQKKYFELHDDAPPVFERSSVCLESYTKVLERVNTCRFRSCYPLGSETSGGLDSSTITAYAARHSKNTESDLHTFGYAFCEDEPSYVLETSRFYGITNNHILTGMGTASQLQQARQRSLVLLGYPEEHANGSSHDPFYRICETFGIRTLLSGFGGDEVVTNNGHLLFDELIDHKKYGLLYKNLTGSAWTRPARFARTLYRSHSKNGNMSALAKIYAQRWNLYAVLPAVSDRYGIREKYIESASYYAPYRTINQFILGDRLSPYVPTRLENCTLIAAGRGVEYRWPLLDHRLLQQYLSTPSIEKYGQGYGRYLHRRAMAGLVPDKITWKLSKAMGPTVLPNGYDSKSAGGELGTLYEECLNNLHPGLESVVDVSKLRDQMPQINKLDRVRDLDRWMPLYLQHNQIRNLNDWLFHYYS